jgi:MYXO-CTERM domain-containing protein
MTPFWFLLLLSFPPDAPSFDPAMFAVRVPFTERVSEAIARGELTLERGLALRELAVRDPEKLPEPWRARAMASRIPGWAGTGVLVENFQIRKKWGLRDDAGFPAPLALFLDSELFPIRVEYPEVYYEELARAVLHGAEVSWQKEIVEWGFLMPPHVTAENRYRILVADTGMQAAGYLRPVDYWWDTPWDDCTSWIMIDWQNNPEWVRDTVAHELSHATQAAMDCLEHIGFWENTSTFIEGQVEPGLGIWFQDAVLEYFQREPHRSVAAGEYMDYYWYGGFFWPHVLASLYAGEDEPAVFVRRVWEGAMQESGGYENTVSYMESIDALLAGRDASLNEAHEAFAVQRMLVGDWASSPMARVQWADRYNTRPPTVGELILSDLGSAKGPVGSLPQAYGTNYWQVEWPSDYTRQLRVALSSQQPGPWTLLLFDPRQETLHTARQVDGLAELVFSPTFGQDAILAVVRGGDDTFDPEMPGAGADYRLDFGPLIPDPIVDHVTPFEQLQGDQAELTVSGLHFQEGATVSFLPDQIEVLQVRFVSDGQMEVSILVPQDAPLGAYELRVTNPDGGAHTFGRAVFVKPAPARPALDGDGCTSAPGRPAATGPWLLLGLFGLAGLIRRRWT